jgi:hypothetical protein
MDLPFLFSLRKKKPARQQTRDAHFSTCATESHEILVEFIGLFHA